MKWPAYLATVLLAACKATVSTAVFHDQDAGLKVVIESEPSHPTLAEYRRKLIVLADDRRGEAIALAKDTGGYSAFNLYKCSGGVFLLRGYFDEQPIDPKGTVMLSGNCEGERVYLGAFDGGGARGAWSFQPASERPEVDLELRSDR